MKKLLYLLAFSPFLLTGCISSVTNEEGVQSNAIKFKQIVNKDSRSLNTSNFNKFYVYGFYTKGADTNTRFNVFNDTEVTKGNDGAWTVATNRYWINGATYSFYAFSCENKDIAPQFGSASLENGNFILNYTCHLDPTDNSAHDLLFASNTNITGKETGNTDVSLKFQHILSMIDLKFISEFPEEYNIEISNISIQNFKNDGMFTASNNPNSGPIGTWSDVKLEGEASNFSLTTTGAASTKKDGNPVLSSPAYMIPNSYASGDNPVKIKFDIKVTNPSLPAGQQTILSHTLTGSWRPIWIMGTHYTYNIRLSGSEAGMDAIKFSVSIEDWNEPGEGNQPQDITIEIDMGNTQG